MKTESRRRRGCDVGHCDDVVRASVGRGGASSARVRRYAALLNLPAYVRTRYAGQLGAAGGAWGGFRRRPITICVGVLTAVAISPTSRYEFWH